MGGSGTTRVCTEHFLLCLRASVPTIAIIPNTSSSSIHRTCLQRVQSCVGRRHMLERGVQMNKFSGEPHVMRRRCSTKKLVRPLAILCFLVSMLHPAAGAEIISVGPTGDYETIQEALDVSGAGDEIAVEQGTYEENLLFPGLDIIVRSTDPTDPVVVANTIIDGAGRGSVVTFDGQETPACVLTGFTITNGEAETGGGINARGSEATIEHNVVISAREI